MKPEIRIIPITLLMFLFLLSSHILYSQNNTYPTEERLFHIERSKNNNMVCYDVNLADGKLNTKEPLNIYWINREKEPGKKVKLTAIQRKLAYGYKLISNDDESSNVTLSAYPDRELTVRKQGSKYVCIIMINKKPAILQSLYVKSKESNSLSVEYIDLKGINLETKQPVSERVINK